MVSISVLIVFFGVTWYSAQAGSLIKSFTFSDGAKRFAADLHNDLRSKIAKGELEGQPSASNMIELEWDDRLGEKAKSYSEKCRFEHSDGENAGIDGFDWVGENLSVGTARKINNENDWKKYLEDGFDLWAKESADFRFPKTCRRGEMCGHYTQLVWAKTRKFGCGISHCRTVDGTDVDRTGPSYNMVCNYGPGGNFNNENPYKEGKACSNCPKNASKCQDNKLCK